MADLPILFSGEMVRAILDGRKTQTRRLAAKNGKPSRWQKVKPGDRLYVKEQWRTDIVFDELSPSKIAAKCVAAGYEEPWADLWFPSTRSSLRDAGAKPGRLRSARFMPRWASRLTLVVTGVRVERLHEISEDDALAEGGAVVGCLSCSMPMPCGCADPDPTAIESFASIWDEIHGEYAWHDNPEVVALTFNPIRENIDRVPA